MPPPLQEIVELFRRLPEGERRALLMHYATQAASAAPAGAEAYQINDIRQDAQCSDVVGVHLSLEDGRLRLALSLGPRVQTLTRAMAAILHQGLRGCSPGEVLAVPEDVITAIVGETLVRQRSQTAFYLLRRLRAAVEALAGAAPAPSRARQQGS